MEEIGFGAPTGPGEPRQLAAVYEGFTYFADGDVLVAKITPSFENGKGAIARELIGGIGFGTTELHVLRPQAIDGLYLNWLVQSRVFRHGGAVMMTGAAGQQRVPEDYVADFRVPVDYEPAQRRIADFLDRETGRIDALIDKKRRLIDLLEEKRIATITHAVTKGLDPTVPMKDSGIPWVGEIPAHWNRLRVRHGVTRITSGSRGWAQHYSDEGQPFLRIANLRRDGIDLDLSDLRFVNPPGTAERDRTLIRRGDVLVSITAEIGLVAVLEDWNLIPSYPSQHLALVSPADSVATRWLAYALAASSAQAQLDASRYGGTKTQLALEDVLNVSLPWPPPREQSAIAAWIDDRVSKIAKAAEAVRGQLDLLAEYREALITAAVTGEIDVDTFDGDRHLEEGAT